MQNCPATGLAAERTEVVKVAQEWLLRIVVDWSLTETHHDFIWAPYNANEASVPRVIYSFRAHSNQSSVIIAWCIDDHKSSFENYKLGWPPANLVIMPSVGHDWCVLRAAATLGRSFPPFRSYSITSTTHQSMTACECGGRKWVSCSRILKSAWLTFDDAVRRRLFRSMLPSL